MWRLDSQALCRKSERRRFLRGTRCQGKPSHEINLERQCLAFPTGTTWSTVRGFVSGNFLPERTRLLGHCRSILLKKCKGVHVIAGLHRQWCGNRDTVPAIGAFADFAGGTLRRSVLRGACWTGELDLFHSRPRRRYHIFHHGRSAFWNIGHSDELPPMVSPTQN